MFDILIFCLIHLIHITFFYSIFIKLHTREKLRLKNYLKRYFTQHNQTGFIKFLLNDVKLFSDGR